MSEKLAKFALQKLRNSVVEVILNRRVIEATHDRIKLNDDTIILTNTIIWSAGVAPSLLTSNLICDPNTGNPYPPTAQHAIREGSTAAKNIIASMEAKLDERKAFDYKTRGM